eukprot:7264257-Prymnesium_polylepis.1
MRQQSSGHGRAFVRLARSTLFARCVTISLPLLTALSPMRDACETLLHTLAKPFIYDITVCP